MDALEFGLTVKKPGFNLFVSSDSPTSKLGVISSYVSQISEKEVKAHDWIYVFNFKKRGEPLAISLASGKAVLFAKAVDNLVSDLKEEIPAVLGGEDFENTVAVYSSEAAERKSRLYDELEKLCVAHNFQIRSTRAGIETTPMLEGKILSEEEYATLEDKLRKKIEKKRRGLEPQIMEFARSVRRIDRSLKELIDKIKKDYVAEILNALFEEIEASYERSEPISTYLGEMKTYIIDHSEEFLPDLAPEAGSEAEEYEDDFEENKLYKYKVNIFIDNQSLKGSPVLYESNPTFYNLFGKIEKNIEHGTYYTDFSMIRPGAIQKSNGGYLLLHALDLFKHPQIWETLKRVIRSRKAFIEDLGEQVAMIPTSGLKPEPIDLDVKIILFGTSDIYQALTFEDEEFSKLFKVKIDFDYRMNSDLKNITKTLDFIDQHGE